MLVHQITFRVKGVTFENEEDKDIQKGIKKILNEYKKNDFFGELYGGYTNKEIIEYDLNVSEYENVKLPAKLVGDEYNGEDCLKIYLKTYYDDYFHVGYAPKEDLDEISEWLTREDLKCEGNIEVIGGKYKHCEVIENDEYEEVEKVVIEELNYGLEVYLSFYNDEIDPEIIKIREEEEERRKKIERNLKMEEIIPYIVVAIVTIPVIIAFISFFYWLFE